MCYQQKEWEWERDGQSEGRRDGRTDGRTKGGNESESEAGKAAGGESVSYVLRVFWGRLEEAHLLVAEAD